MKGNRQQLLKVAVEYYRFLNTMIEAGNARAAYKLEDNIRTLVENASDGKDSRMLLIGQTDDSGKYTSVKIYENHNRDCFTVEI